MLIDELTEFLAERLKRPPAARNDKPCLAESWWVEDRLAEGRRFPLPKLSQEEGLRFCWRVARNHNVERLMREGRYMLGEPADLLLHQITELVPAMFGAAKRIFEEQRAASGIETPGRDTEERRGAKHESPTRKAGDAQ